MVIPILHCVLRGVTHMSFASPYPPFLTTLGKSCLFCHAWAVLRAQPRIPATRAEVTLPPLLCISSKTRSLYCGSSSLDFLVFVLFVFHDTPLLMTSSLTF